MNRIIDSEVGGGPVEGGDPDPCNIETEDNDYVLIGTLYKQMQNRPSVCSVAIPVLHGVYVLSLLMSCSVFLFVLIANY